MALPADEKKRKKNWLDQLLGLPGKENPGVLDWPVEVAERTFGPLPREKRPRPEEGFLSPLTRGLDEVMGLKEQPPVEGIPGEVVDAMFGPPVKSAPKSAMELAPQPKERDAGLEKLLSDMMVSRRSAGIEEEPGDLAAFGKPERVISDVDVSPIGGGKAPVVVSERKVDVLAPKAVVEKAGVDVLPEGRSVARSAGLGEVRGLGRPEMNREDVSEAAAGDFFKSRGAGQGSIRDMRAGHEGEWMDLSTADLNSLKSMDSAAQQLKDYGYSGDELETALGWLSRNMVRDEEDPIFDSYDDPRTRWMERLIMPSRKMSQQGR